MNMHLRTLWVAAGVLVLATLAGTAPAEAQSCGEIGGDYCSQNGLCPGGYYSLGGTYDCHPCCKAGPSCGGIGGDYCSQSGGCPPGYESFGQTYDCNPCCKSRGLPSCDELGGICKGRCKPWEDNVGPASDCRNCCIDGGGPFEPAGENGGPQASLAGEKQAPECTPAPAASPAAEE